MLLININYNIDLNRKLIFFKLFFLFKSPASVEILKNIILFFLIFFFYQKNTFYSSFFDFDSSVQPFDQFDVTQCFIDQLTYDFRIKFPYKSIL